MASQGANNGPSQAAGQQFVKFSRQSAQRIAKAVRAVEAGDRGQPGIVFDHPIPGNSPTIRVATFTGVWATGSTHVVNIGAPSGTSTSNTAAAYNAFLPLKADGPVRCLIGRATPTTDAKWHLLNVNLASLGGFDSSKVQLFGHTTSTSGYVQWYSIATCATSTAA